MSRFTCDKVASEGGGAGFGAVQRWCFVYFCYLFMLDPVLSDLIFLDLPQLCDFSRVNTHISRKTNPEGIKPALCVNV